MATSRRLLAKTVAAQLVAEPSRHNQIMKATAAYMAEHKMLDQSHIFMNDLAKELQIQAGLVSAEVVTARPVSATLLKRLERQLKVATGAKSVSLEASQDPALLGGFILRTPEFTVDQTVRHQLSQLRNIA